MAIFVADKIASGARHERWPVGAVEWWRRAPSPRFRVVLFGIVVVALVVGLNRHAMWLDEVQAWLIVRDSDGLLDLAHNLRYEGHPALWYLVLFPLTVLGRQPEWVQCAQAACALGCVALIVWRGPFSRFELALLPFSYCLLFEYGVKSRSYALGNLLLLSFCALYPRRQAHPLAIGLVLALMANVHALFTIIAIVALLGMLIDQAHRTSVAALPTRSNALCCTVVLVGVAASAITALPPPDSGFAVGWLTDLSPPHVMRTLEGLSGFTLSRPSIKASLVGAAIGVLLVGIGVSRSRRPPGAAFLFVAGTLGMTAFFHVKDLGQPWHHGLLFMVLVASVWIGRLNDPRRDPVELLPRSLFAIVLGLQALHGIASYTRDLVSPYSNGRATAAFIERHGWTHAPTFALDDTTAVSVLGISASTGSTTRRVRAGAPSSCGTTDVWRRSTSRDSSHSHDGHSLQRRSSIAVSIAGRTDRWHTATWPS